MRGRFIIDMHPKADALCVYLMPHVAEDIAEVVEIGAEVMVFKNAEGHVLSVEIILPPEKRTSHDVT